MKPINFLLIVLLLCVSGRVSGADDFSFRNIRLGVSLDAQMKPCEHTRGSIEEKKVVCYEKGYLEASEQFRDYYLVDNLEEMEFYTSTMVVVLDGKIEKVDMSLWDDGADKLLALLKRKYGKPKSLRNYVIQNRMGAKFNQYVATWRVKGCELFLINRIGYGDHASFLITTAKYERYKRDLEKQKKKKDFDKL